ncbi:hypothetical protein [Saccharomonospora sp. CUA-673]|uniref:hypothetical protein n=1 Tax=Saccharomonospora sp. CUA-673 TaxID=1904969 RepID=UPI000ACE57C0|nr:hypothetical protein [Saccharomonospora sp. CUA-673]
MIVVTGATGALNGATVEHLLERVPADRIGVSVRDAGRARHLSERGVRVRQAHTTIRPRSATRSRTPTRYCW